MTDAIAQNAKPQRTAFYDNLKFVLIALVLVGHFSGMLIGHDHELKVFWRWIYLFHMPAFLFVGGVFSKKLYTRETGLKVDTIAYYVVMGILLYTSLWAFKHLWSAHPGYNLIMMGSIPWYFFAMAGLGCFLPIVSKIRGGWKTVVPFAVVGAVLAGFIDQFNDFLVTGRIFAYAPFYFAGYFTSIKGFDAWAKRTRKRIWPIILAIAFMIGVFVLLEVVPKRFSGTMSGLGTGHNPYSHYKDWYLGYQYALIRLLDIGIAAGMILALAMVVPSKRLFISDLGSRTLQVYFFHPFIYYYIDAKNLFDPLIPYMPASGWIVVGCAVVLAGLLAWPKWPDKLFRGLKSLIRIDTDDAPKKPIEGAKS